jgi:hypothetical protein
MDPVGTGCHPVPVTPHDDHSQQRRPLFLPVVIATALLTIIGLVGGYLLSERRSGEPGPGETWTPTLIATGPACLPQTQKMGSVFGADGELREVLRVRTESRTVAWICEDRGGRLFYHANKGGAEAPWVENKTALFLDNVQHDGVGDFAAAASDGNVFTVNANRLLITHKDGRIEEQAVVPE